MSITILVEMTRAIGFSAQSGQYSERYGTVELGIIYYCYCLHTQRNECRCTGTDTRVTDN